MKKLSIIVPCYNEQESIPLFYSAVEKVVDKINASIEYWFINDGSSDSTMDELEQLNNEYPNRVHFVDFSRNFGKEAALYAGLQYASGDYIVVMDVDLQDPPELLPKMFDLINDGKYDCVGARRINRTGEGKIRSFFSHMFYSFINRLSDVNIVPDVRDFRMMTRQMVNAVLQLTEYNRFSKGIFSWVGFKTTYLEYNNRGRVAGETDWSFWQLLRYAADGIIDFSDTPLSIAICLGVVSAVLSFAGLIIVVVRHFLEPNASAFGWSSMVCILLMISGIQLFCLGIVGKYIGKIYLQTKKRPLYIMRQKK